MRASRTIDREEELYATYFGEYMFPNVKYRIHN